MLSQKMEYLIDPEVLIIHKMVMNDIGTFRAIDPRTTFHEFRVCRKSGWRLRKLQCSAAVRCGDFFMLGQGLVYHLRWHSH